MLSKDWISQNAPSKSFVHNALLPLTDQRILIYSPIK